MREYIDILREAAEVKDNVVDLQQHKTGKAFSNYLSVVNDIYKGEADFFASGKFMPFAKTYIDNGFERKFLPSIELTVWFRDWRLSPEARELVRQLRAERFTYVAPTKWAKGARPKGNPNQEPYGPWLWKRIDINQAREIFQERAASPYGAYQPSRSGFRTAQQHMWDERGVGFHLIVGGYDSRRGDKYENAFREEHHIIDDDKDMAEVVNMFAAIRRAQIKGV